MDIHGKCMICIIDLCKPIKIFLYFRYVPGLTGDQWKKFGLNATIQGHYYT